MKKGKTLLDESSKIKLEKILNPDKIKYEVISLKMEKCMVTPMRKFT